MFLLENQGNYLCNFKNNMIFYKKLTCTELKNSELENSSFSLFFIIGRIDFKYNIEMIMSYFYIIGKLY